MVTLTVQSLIRQKILAIFIVNLLIMMLLLLSGCATTPSYSTTQVQSINLEPQALETDGIAFITPTTITGQEEDKQALALVFTETLKQARPNLRIISLPATLGVISREGLANEYKRMFEDYLLTGIFNQDTLKKISHLTGVRYLAQLKLVGFNQLSQDRWGFLGLSLVKTEITSLRLYLQIWDGESGTIAWEGSQELTLSRDTTKEAPVSFQNAVERSAAELLVRLP